ncbi:hypothetical protein [Saccharopolyspora shandongensis]|uniref:hypothetical protein n=1 Tax=Saccharopolyspora shandongensis TaxID=418495 RepID=UPI001C432F3B|nr:hypothetical protein [Saccharopolyspora shandongensis]
MHRRHGRLGNGLGGWPTENGWVHYNALQQLAYFTTVFVAAALPELPRALGQNRPRQRR